MNKVKIFIYLGIFYIFFATLNKFKHSISEGTPLVKGICDKATKTCGDFGLIHLSADLLACLCCKTSC